MSYEIRADYGEQFLFPPAVEDWVERDHPARFIRDLVDSMDLKELGFRARKAKEGRPNYAADLLLKVWVYAYLEGIRSPRKLERACRNHMALIWLTGRNYPDHNTLWRFLDANRGRMKAFFRQVVRVAMDAELVGLVAHAVDGTKIDAAGSPWSALYRKDLERALAQLDASINEVMKEIESREKAESGNGEYRLPEHLEALQARKKAIEESLEKLREEGRNQYHPKDEEARMMQSDGRQKWSYNGQAVVDEKSGLIVGEDVTNHETDNQSLVPMVEEVENNIGQAAEETVADAGYRSAEQFGEAMEKGYEVLVSSHPDEFPKKNQYHVSQFKYDPERDCCICPEGKELPFVAVDAERNARVYYCRNSKDCPVRSRCTRAKAGRKIKISAHHRAIVHQRHKREKPDKRKLLRRRKAIIEPVFGHIKEALGFRRWSVRGLEKVRSQWSLLCAVFNLKKLLPHWRAGQLTL